MLIVAVTQGQPISADLMPHQVLFPGRGAAFFMPLRRAGTVQGAGIRYDPGSAAHRFAKSYALRCVRGT
jgi:hypothetical protein